MWELLLGAGVTLATTTFVQLWVVPRVDSGKRREDRWERDVIALSEFLAFDYAEVQARAVAVLHTKVFMAEVEHVENVNRVRLEEQRRQSDRESRETFDALSRAQKRAGVLLGRVTYLDRDRTRAMRAEIALMLAGSYIDKHSYQADDSLPLTTEEVLAVQTKASDALAPLETYLQDCLVQGRGARAVSFTKRLRRLRSFARRTTTPREAISEREESKPDD